MTTIVPLRQESVTNLEQWRKSNQGLLQWVELIEDGFARVDKMTYTMGDLTEFVLSKESQYSIELFYFADDFTADQALTFLKEMSEQLMAKLHALRQQV